MVSSVVFYHRFILNVNATLSTLGNCLLIYLIARYTKSNIGRYRHLMTMFAVFEMVYSYIHVLVCLEVHMQNHIWLAVYDGLFMDYLGRDVQAYISMAFCGFFSQSLAILGYHFLYRYIAICRRNYLYIFERVHTVFILLFVYLFVPTIWYSVCLFLIPMTREKDEYVAVEFQKIYNTSIYEHGYHGPLYKNAEGWVIRDCIGMAILVSVVTIAATAIILFAFLTQRALNSVAISSASRLLQKQLFKVLIMQTFIPLCTAHIPVGIIFLGPVFGWNSDINIGYFNSIMLSVFPVIDPFIMIYFLRDYRTGVKQIIFRMSVNKRTGVEQTNPVASNSGKIISPQELTAKFSTQGKGNENDRGTGRHCNHDSNNSLDV